MTLESDGSAVPGQEGGTTHEVSSNPHATESDQSGTVGLALSGGAVLGCAHIGVLKAFDEAGVRITHLSGTSMGALIAAFYASGLPATRLETIAGELRWPHVTRLSASRLGLLSQEKLKQTLRRHLGDMRLEDTRIPTAFVTTDISTGEKVVLETGDLATAASASACFPGIFVPVEMDGRLLVDGGLVENLPFSPLRTWGVDRIVGVDVFLGMTFQRPKRLLDLIKNSVDIVLVQAARPQVSKADLLIAPDLHGFSSTEFKDVPGLVEAGYRAGREAVAENPWLLS